MSHPLRIEFPDAWYHVMNRGRRAEKIFNHATDYQVFVDLLKETDRKLKARLNAITDMVLKSQEQT